MAELVGVLLTHRQDAKVLTTWENTVHDVYPDSVYVDKNGIVIIDADGNHYRDVLIRDGAEEDSW